MQHVVGAIFDEKPDDVTVYKSSVQKLVSATEIDVKVDDKSDETMKKWQCDIDVYSIVEYIKVMDDEVKSVASNQGGADLSEIQEQLDTILGLNEEE